MPDLSIKAGKDASLEKVRVLSTPESILISFK